MSIFDNIFGKKPLPYEYDQAKPEHPTHPQTDSSSKNPKNVKPHSNMPPLVINKTADASPKTTDNVPNSPANDAEDEPFTDWARESETIKSNQEQPVGAKPNKPVWPSTEPVAPDKETSQRPKRFGSDFGSRPYVWPPIIPKITEKEVFAFVVENSNATMTQKESIINIISQIVDRKKEAIFLFVRVGNNQRPFLPMDYNSVKAKDVISSLITESVTDESPNLASALFYLLNNLNVFAKDTFSFDETKYKLGACSIVCVGTGECSLNEDSSKIIASCIANLQNISKLKTFKYFCINDSDAIRVASLGFPVIGHIISDFYNEEN